MPSVFDYYCGSIHFPFCAYFECHNKYIFTYFTFFCKKTSTYYTYDICQCLFNSLFDIFNITIQTSLFCNLTLVITDRTFLNWKNNFQCLLYIGLDTGVKGRLNLGGKSLGILKSSNAKKTDTSDSESSTSEEDLTQMLAEYNMLQVEDSAEGTSTSLITFKYIDLHEY